MGAFLVTSVYNLADGLAPCGAPAFSGKWGPVTSPIRICAVRLSKKLESALHSTGGIPTVERCYFTRLWSRRSKAPLISRDITDTLEE